MVLKRFVNGADKEPFFQKRAPTAAAAVHPHRQHPVPQRPFRRPRRLRRARRRALGRQPRLPRPQPLAGARQRRRPPGRAAHRPRPDAGGHVRARQAAGDAGQRDAEGLRLPRLRQDLRLARHPHPTCASSRSGSTRTRAAPSSPSRARSSGATRRSPPPPGGRKSATASSSTTTRTRATAPSPAPTRCVRRRTPASRAPSSGTRCRTASSPTYTIETVPARYAKCGDPHAEIEDVQHSLEPLLELVREQEKQGLGEAPLPPQFPKAEGEPLAGAAQPQGRCRDRPRRSANGPHPDRRENTCGQIVYHLK